MNSSIKYFPRINPFTVRIMNVISFSGKSKKFEQQGVVCVLIIVKQATIIATSINSLEFCRANTLSRLFLFICILYEIQKLALLQHFSANLFYILALPLLYPAGEHRKP